MIPRQRELLRRLNVRQLPVGTHLVLLGVDGHGRRRIVPLHVLLRHPAAVAHRLEALLEVVRRDGARRDGDSGHERDRVERGRRGVRTPHGPPDEGLYRRD